MEENMKKFHENEAKNCFNNTWVYLEKKNRSFEDDLTMIHLAHASRYHWGVIGQPLHHQRGEWLISKVYYTLNKGEQALYHAEACYKICNQHNIMDFDIAFAYEALANAYKLLNDVENVSLYMEKAFACLAQIEDPEDRAYTESELKKSGQ
ncbi:MAG: hypothetical protein JXR88_12190 [Clostridia bacterium]|nr:hypothetical protein [Clostridia bacterium]